MTATARRIPLGKSTVLITPIGLGCWQFSGGQGLVGSFWPALSQDEVDAIVRASIEAGSNWFDTAEGYGNGHSERALNHALRRATDTGALTEEPVIATKWWPVFRFAGNLRSSVAERREALGGRVIDLHQIHQRISFSSLKAQMDALADIVEQGHARTVGVSNFGAAAMRKSAALLEARGVSLAANQVRYSLLDRRIEKSGVLDEAERLGVTIIAYSPLAQGILTGRFHAGGVGAPQQVSGVRRRMPSFRANRLQATAPVVSLLRDIAREHGCTPAQVALAWVIQRRPGVVAAIPGASTPAQAEMNARSMAVELSAGEIAQLDRVSSR